jgi:multidrug resistance efflux pump
MIGAGSSGLPLRSRPDGAATAPLDRGGAGVAPGTDDNQQLEIATERFPGWIERGLAFRAVGLAALMMGAVSLLPWRQGVEIPLVLATPSPPRGVVTGDQGVLVSVTARDGAWVRAGDVLARLGSASEIGSVERAAEFARAAAETLERGGIPGVPPALALGGELQTHYAALGAALGELRLHSQFGDDLEAIAAIRGELRALDARRARLLEEIVIARSMVAIAEQQLAMKSEVAAQGWISQGALADARQALLRQQLVASGKADELERIGAAAEQARSRLTRTGLARGGDNARLTQNARRAVMELLGAVEAWRRRIMLTAPVSGRVTYPRPVHVGQTLPRGTEFAVVTPETSGVVAHGIVPTWAKGDVRPGANVRLTIPSYPPYRFGWVLGRVDAVSDVATAEGYQIRVALPRGLTTSYGHRIPFRQRTGVSGVIRLRQGRFFDYVVGTFRARVETD